MQGLGTFLCESNFKGLANGRITIWQAGEPAKRALHEVNSQFYALEIRLQRLERHVTSDNFDLKKTKLSVYDTSCINASDYKKGWQFVPMKSLRNNSDLNFTSHNFAVEEFATYFVKTDHNSDYVAAVSNSKDPGDLE